MFLKQFSLLRKDKVWLRAVQAAHRYSTTHAPKTMVASFLENAIHKLGLPKQHQELKKNNLALLNSYIMRTAIESRP